MPCDSLTHSHCCSIASEIAGIPAAVGDDACAVCQANQQPNAVTVSIALAAVRDTCHAATIVARWGHLLAGSDSTAALRERAAIVAAGTGPGSQLWRCLASIGIRHDPPCASCLALAEAMNQWGAAGCRQRRAQIAKRLRVQRGRYGMLGTLAAAGRAARTGLVWRLSVSDPYGSLVDEAIRLAEVAVQPFPIDIVLPLGPGSRHDHVELRVALRSIRRHAIGVRRVWVIGAVPPWLHQTDWLRPIKRAEFRCNKASRISQKILWAFENLDLTPTVAFWNDDYCMLRDQDVRLIPPIYRGELWRRPTNNWKRLQQHTAAVLHAAGHTVHHYDIHVPILYERDKWLAIRDWWERSRADSLGLIAKSIYANIHCRQTGIPGRDCKLLSNWQSRITRDRTTRRWIVSYGDAALDAGFGKWLLSRFPNPIDCEAAKTSKLRRVRGRRNQECVKC